MEIREPARSPDRFFLIVERSDRSRRARVSISPVEHNLSYEACYAKVEREGRLPPIGRWVKPREGEIMLGRAWHFPDRSSGNLEAGDFYEDPDTGNVVVNVDGTNLVEFPASRFDFDRDAENRLTVRKTGTRDEPVSLRIEAGELTVKDLTRTRDDEINGF